jgi:hypothetical protein
VLSIPASAQQQQGAASAVDSLALARKWTGWFYANRMDSLSSAFQPTQQTPELRQNLERYLVDLIARGGSEAQVVDEKFIKRNGNTQYWRTAKFATYDAEPIQIRWAVNTKWEIIGIGINPQSMAPPIDK